MTAIVIEARWVAAGLQNQLRTAWRWWCTVAVIAGLGISAGNYLVAIIAAAYVAGLAVWARVWPHSYVRLISLPLWRSRTKYRIRKVWLSAVVAAGLETRTIAMNGRRARSRLRAARMKWSNTDLLVRVTLAVGMTVDDVKAALPSLTSTFGALSSKFVSGSQLWLCFRFADSLASIPCSSGAFESDRARNVTVGDSIVGSKDDGTEWALRLSGRHTLIAGVSGAGKSSLFWAIAAGLGPQISDGLTRLHGIDLKGGVELAMGREMFCRIATDTEHAVLLLEDIVVRMRERMARMAGRSRQHRPSQDEPLEVVFVDEIAALLAYVSDRELQKRAKEAVSLICSQGRAVGFVMLACLQDPRKETVPNRGLFTQMIGLRLKDREETSMVLGDGAVLAGAECHKIPANMPGVGFLIPDGGRDPIRVRARYFGDADIQQASRAFTTPQKLPIPEPKHEAPIKGAGRSGRRSGRKDRAEKTGRGNSDV